MSSPSTSPVTLHFLNNSRAESILWTLEEVKAPYEIKYYQRLPSLLAPKELKDIHPLGKSPVITHNGLVIAETGNIIQYLIKTFAPDSFSPPSDSPEMDNKNNYYLHYSEGSLMPILVNKLVFSKFPEMSPWYVRPVITGFATQVNKLFLDKNLAAHYAMLNDELLASKTGWFCSGPEPTAADFALFYPLLALSKGRGGALECPESIKKWVEKAQARPALQASYSKLEEVEKANAPPAKL